MGLLVWGSSQCVAYGCSAAARRKLRAARSGCEAAARLSPSSAWKKEACSGCEALAAVAAVASSASVQQPIASSVRRSLECPRYAARTARPRLVRARRTYSGVSPGQAALRLRFVQHGGSGACVSA